MKKVYNEAEMNNVVATPDFLVESHQYLINKLAYQLVRYYHFVNVKPEELYTIGYFALCKAAKRYDDSRACSFKTFASDCIWNDMLKEVDNLVMTVRHPGNRFGEHLIVNDDSCATDSEEWRPSLFERIAYERLPYEEQELAQQELREAIPMLISHLSAAEYALVNAYYGLECEPMNLREIAEQSQVSAQAVHKRLARIHRKLFNYLRSYGFDPMCA